MLVNLDVSVSEGEYLALMGPSGSGKTTLLNLIAGLDRATRGEVIVHGQDLGELSESQITRWRANNVGFIFQTYNLIPVLTAFENVELPLLLTHLSRRKRKENVTTALKIVGLDGREHHYPRQLSGGQEQRVAIARAIVTDPYLLVADEPTGDLDRTTAGEILDLLELLNREFQKTIIMVTHDPLAARRAVGRSTSTRASSSTTSSTKPGCRPRHEIPQLHLPECPAQSGPVAPDRRLDEYLPLPDDGALLVLRHVRRGQLGARVFNRIATLNANGFAGRIPIACVKEINQLEGVVAATPFSWYGGKYKDEILPFAQFAVDPATVFTVMSEFTMPDDQLKAFQENKDGCVIGRKLANDKKLKVGDPLPLKGDAYPVDLDLTVRGIYDGPSDRDLRMCFINFEYLDEALKRDDSIELFSSGGQRAGNAGMIFTRCKRPTTCRSSARRSTTCIATAITRRARRPRRRSGRCSRRCWATSRG